MQVKYKRIFKEIADSGNMVSAAVAQTLEVKPEDLSEGKVTA